jgi:hypothetical protein
MGMSESFPSYPYLTNLSHSFDVHQGSPDHLQGGKKSRRILRRRRSSQTSRQGHRHFRRPHKGLGSRFVLIRQCAQPSKACAGRHISKKHGERCVNAFCFPPSPLPMPAMGCLCARGPQKPMKAERRHPHHAALSYQAAGIVPVHQAEGRAFPDA